ncbi:uncharacterized protein BJ212DRAFT_1298377 [Suillus subaureus]|uniref:DUF6532 domain-containing protein n=1 Tax=Suillus subaureus TaxID=48587 RepID=A0A9P7EEI5_9AGAM|nr:uncharacterized protein BJ212DRAFT_1298377 [Suillus subaureus]KAG1819112.1 hypothetical protein BJ212DRAFT_1298377 [Suillus subaureus]
MPPHAIASPKMKKSKHKGSDASGRAGLPKKSHKAAEFTEAPSMPLVSLGLSKAVAEDSAPQHSGRPNTGTRGRNHQMQKIGAVLKSQSQGHPPKGSTSLTSNIPVNPQGPEPAHRGQKGHSKVVPPPYSSLAITNSPALSINNTNPIFSMQPPGRSLEETNNPYVAIGVKVAKKCTAKMASDQTSSNVVPLLHTTFMRQHLDPALFEEDNSVRPQSVLNIEDEEEDDDNSGSLSRLCWKSFLEHTKGECHVEHALEDPFLTSINDLAGSITEVLIATLVAWDREGKQFKAGIWPEQKCSMAQLNCYKLIPAQEHATWIEGATSQLLARSEFLQFGLDALGKTRNFTHIALHDVSTAFFYMGPYQIAQKRPDIFHKQLPISCLALVSTMYNCVLDSLAKNGHGKSYPKFSAKEYSPIYCQMLRMIKKIPQHPYHSPMATSLELNGTEETRHNHLQIVLN